MIRVGMILIAGTFLAGPLTHYTAAAIAFLGCGTLAPECLPR